MPEVTNKPSVTEYQVGETVYIANTNALLGPATAVIEKTESIVVDVNEDGTGEQTNYYYFVGMGAFSLPESLVFSSAEDLEAYYDNLIDQL